ncbi:MAG: sigma 54-interacting transcriptional regulator, partial [Lentisphaerae bacterium]|nr:sigma 54-interacting transcriptional regulator [Lentisphaerota bacterium]
MPKTDAASPTLIITSEDGEAALRIRKAKLLAVSGPLQGREFMMDNACFTIGSAPDNDLVLDDTTVSRRHCEIQVVPEGTVIRDLGSTNGTVVRGIRITEAFLEQGSEIRLGKTRFIFCPLRESAEYTLSARESFGSVLGASIPMRRIFHLAETYAPTDATVLIEGETGTGKEILAEELHRHSPRASKPFVVIDCATLARELVESELFGHKKGAFTGATADRAGAFEHADGGTVFLDEINDLSPELQPKLLRVLERKEIRRLGTSATRPVDVRIVCATNRKLRNEVNAGRFREDLYFRLSVARIELPPLRKRPDDIPLLVDHFLKEFCGGAAEDTLVERDKTMALLKAHAWPGNVRELRNLIELSSYDTRRPIDLSAFLYAGVLQAEQES